MFNQIKVAGDKLLDNRIKRAFFWILVSFAFYFAFLAVFNGSIHTPYAQGYTYSEQTGNGPVVTYKANGEILTNFQVSTYYVILGAILCILLIIALFAYWKFASQLFSKNLYRFLFLVVSLPLLYIAGSLVSFFLWYKF